MMKHHYHMQKILSRPPILVVGDVVVVCSLSVVAGVSPDTKLGGSTGASGICHDSRSFTAGFVTALSK